jgi:hypothetical protein
MRAVLAKLDTDNLCRCFSESNLIVIIVSCDYIWRRDELVNRRQSSQSEACSVDVGRLRSVPSSLTDAAPAD